MKDLPIIEASTYLQTIWQELTQLSFIFKFKFDEINLLQFTMEYFCVFKLIIPVLILISSRKRKSTKSFYPLSIQSSISYTYPVNIIQNRKKIERTNNFTNNLDVNIEYC